MSKKHYYKCVIGLLKLQAMQCFYFKNKDDFLKACVAYNLNISDLTFYFYKKGVLGATREGLLSENVQKLNLFINNPTIEKPSLYLKLCGLPIRCIPQIDSLNTINHIRIVLGVKPFYVLPDVLFKIKVNDSASPRYITEIMDWINKIPILCEYNNIINVIHNDDDWKIIKKETFQKTIESNKVYYKSMEKHILKTLNSEHICSFCYENLGEQMLKYISKNYNPNLVVWDELLDNVTEDKNSEVKEEVLSEVPNKAKEEVLSEVKEEVLSEVKEKVLSEVKEEVLSEVKEKVLSEAKEEVLSEVKEEVLSEVILNKF